MANYARNERQTDRQLTLPSATPLVLPEPVAASEALTLPSRSQPAHQSTSLPPGLHVTPIRFGSDVIAVVNDSNNLSARLESLRSHPEGMKDLVKALSKTENHDSAFHGMNGVEVLQGLLSQRQTVTQLVNSGAFRSDTSSFTREVADLQRHNIELAQRIS